MVNWRDLKKLLKLMDENNLVELSIEEDQKKITLKKAQPVIISNIAKELQATLTPQKASEGEPAIKEEASSQEVEKKIIEVKSPLVGTFYRAPKPGAPPFVNLNDKVTKGQTLCIVEAMKVMNEIKSEIDGVIVEICAKDGEPVDFGRVLFKIKSLD
jgi:acetyl-CoA carboxylase biotin carboxyl carrier protein